MMWAIKNTVRTGRCHCFNRMAYSIDVGYRHFDTFGVKPRYAFGFGLSYTSFDIRYQEISLRRDQILTLARITNTGSMAGQEAAQLYASVPFGSCSELKLRESR